MEEEEEGVIRFFLFSFLCRGGGRGGTGRGFFKFF